MTDEALLVDREFILPGDATPLERAIADTDGRLDDIDTDLVRRVKAIDEAPATYLSQIAYERSVDVWDPAWPEDVQRDVDRAAPRVHRKKGSPFAVKAALAALRVDATVTQWWETTPRGVPYTFEVRAFARARLYDGPLLDARLIRAVFASIMRTKPATRAFDLIVGVGMTSTLTVAAVNVSRSHLALVASPVPASAERLALGLAPAIVARSRVSFAAVFQLPPP